MNTFKRLTTALALSTAFFAHNVQAAPSDSACVALGRWGVIILEMKKAGVSEDFQMKKLEDIKHRVTKATMTNVLRYIYLDDGAHVDGKYLYLKCKVGHFD